MRMITGGLLTALCWSAAAEAGCAGLVTGKYVNLYTESYNNCTARTTLHVYLCISDANYDSKLAQWTEKTNVVYAPKPNTLKPVCGPNSTPVLAVQQQSGFYDTGGGTCGGN
ncbi:hypothetical protein [Chromobacterium amazonense]|uniref:hypothetical protein n=1 Tax=Chromobacterium amazonense TaxID=1382803 RepID=UPI003F794A90